MSLFGKLVAFIYIKAKSCYLRENISKLTKDFPKDSVIRYPSKIVGSKFISIGRNFYCGPDSRIEAISEYGNDQVFKPQIKIGNDVGIQGNCHLGAINRISIGDGCLFGNGVFITDHAHGNSTMQETDIRPTLRDLYSKGEVIIEDNVWLCERVTILPNVKIGKGSIISAGAVVTSDIPPFCIAGGVPAKIIKNIE